MLSIYQYLDMWVGGQEISEAGITMRKTTNAVVPRKDTHS